MSMLYQHLTEHCDDSRIEALLEQLAPALERLKKGEDAAAAPILALPAARDDLAAIQALADDIRGRFCHIVVAGAGGSSLSGRTLTCLKHTLAQPHFHFLESIDPDVLGDVLTHLDMAHSCFIVISKSGATLETLAQFHVLWQHAVYTLGEKAASHFIAITTKTEGNPIYEAAQAHGIQVVAHPADIGGRFSILTPVGLLPAAIAGLNIARLRKGAQSVIDQLHKAPNPHACPPALGAALALAHMQRGHNISVMLPYSERLAGFSSWYRQNWAESLGKNAQASTPIRAVGTTDQHSQLQLYLAGPKDKLFHLILLKRAGTGQRIDVTGHGGFEYIQHKTTGDVMAAEQKATLETLIDAGCPVRVFALETLGEEQMGALLMHFMLEIIFTSYLLGVNAFDQPAVEEGKRLANDYLLTGKL